MSLRLFNKKNQIFRELPLSVKTVFGTGADCRVIIHNNDSIYARHCFIEKQNDKYVLTRYHDQCFVKINDEVVRERSAELYHGDMLYIGKQPKQFQFLWKEKKDLKRPVNLERHALPESSIIGQEMVVSQKTPQKVHSLTTKPSQSHHLADTKTSAPCTPLQESELKTPKTQQLTTQREEIDDEDLEQNAQMTDSRHFISTEADPEETMIDELPKTTPNTSNSFSSISSPSRRDRKRSASPNSSESQAKRARRFEPENLSGFDYLISTFNVNTIARLQQLQQQVEQLRDENIKLKEQLSGRVDSKLRTTPSQVERELLDEKLKYESLYESKVTELMLINDEMQKYKRLYEDMKRQQSDDVTSKVEEKRMRELFLEAKHRLAERESSLRLLENDKENLEESVSSLQKQLDELSARYNSLRTENDRHKLQIQNREALITQTVKSNMEASQQISTDSNQIVNDFNQAKKKITEILESTSNKIVAYKKRIRTQVESICVDADPVGKNTPPDTTTPETTNRMQSKAPSTQSQSYNQDIEKARKILHREVPRITNLTLKKPENSRTIQKGVKIPTNDDSKKTNSAQSNMRIFTTSQTPNLSLEGKWTPSSTADMMNFDHLSEEEDEPQTQMFS